MNIEQVREFALSLAGATEDQAFGEDIVNFRVEGKIFACLWLGGGRYDMRGGVSRVALKLPPERNQQLRGQYGAITPGYHWNKTHWSDVYYAQLDDALVRQLITEAHATVVKKLPRILRAKYEG